MKTPLIIIVLVCVPLLGCAPFEVITSDGTVVQITPEDAVNTAVQKVAPLIPAPWGWIIGAISAAATGIIGARRVGKSKEASYNAGIKLGRDLSEAATIGEPGDGNEPDTRQPVGEVKGPG